VKTTAEMYNADESELETPFPELDVDVGAEFPLVLLLEPELDDPGVVVLLVPAGLVVPVEEDVLEAPVVPVLVDDTGTVELVVEFPVEGRLPPVGLRH